MLGLKRLFEKIGKIFFSRSPRLIWAFPGVLGDRLTVMLCVLYNILFYTKSETETNPDRIA